MDNTINNMGSGDTSSKMGAMEMLQAQLEALKTDADTHTAGGMVGLESDEPIDDGVYEQIMMFELENEIFGLDILRVQEIRSFNAMTLIPNSPDYIIGMMNLRGAIVPVINLRKRFRLQDKEIRETAVIIVLKAYPEDVNQEKTIGILVDSVQDAKNVQQDAMQPAPPDHNARLGEGAVRALVEVAERMVTILDLDRIFQGDFS